jgi:uncharacterized membrane protein
MDILHVMSLFLHLMATVIWVGGLVVMSLILFPVIQTKAKPDEAMQSPLSGVIDAWQKRFVPLSNLSLVVLVVTGTYQMAISPHYQGFMVLNNAWSQMIFIKHIAAIAMVGIGVFMQSVLFPAIGNANLLASKGKTDSRLPALAVLRRRERRLVAFNACLAVVVLICTAVASSIR